MQSDDATEHAALLRGWTMEMAQFSPGRFSGSLVDIRCDHVQFMREKTNTALIKRGQAWKDALVFSIPLQMESTGRYAGRPLAETCVLLNDGMKLADLCTPPALDLICIALDRNWLIDRAAVLGYDDLVEKLREPAQRIELTPVAFARTRAALSGIFDTVCATSAALDHARGLAVLEEALALYVLEASGKATEDNRPMTRADWNLTDRARSYVLDNAEDQPTIYDVCSHVGVSRRKLQNCFNEAFDCSPGQFLRIVRLNKVRRDLRVMSDAKVSATIGDVAARWGFWHWSRFANDYSRFFGELPSETLRKAAQRH
ncbi:helix-turn-helix domain-containing protein [Pseudosulfitobacter sp. DSM 107133]|nr:helix-turn-helix domain-containing protein [Pseudosulfitobacter sp. DSM 107133]UOA29121.1 hypothetical protein DSM107133_03882 [Pseudosulfitobacter sp. DSM 107133]